ncbi:MAG: sigma-70 family RNA polymerase sigma factor [Candidatus Eisenbacteria bacterium]|nr:sigma-70 family RNA polymerase sigma factor [Candidatus Eisenbacteria bacterium]
MKADNRMGAGGVLQSDPRESGGDVQSGELLARARAGDPVAERLLYEQHVERVYRLIYRLTRDADLSEEFTQESFVRAFTRLAQFREAAAFSSWLHAVAVSVTMSGLRRIRRRRRHEQTREDFECGPREDPAAAGERQELRRLLRQAVDALPQRLRIVVVMFYAEGYTHREIGAVLGIPEGTSKARLFQARARLRETLRAGPARALGPLAGLPARQEQCCDG